MADRSGMPAVMNSLLSSIQNIPASIQSSAAGSIPSSRPRNRHGSVHRILGGGKSADVLLWRNRKTSAGLFASVSVAYFLFELSGYTFLSILSNFLLFSVVGLFLWANVASVFNRSPPPIPKPQLSEDTVHKAAAIFRVEINKILLVAHDVTIGKDFRVFLKVVLMLWILSTIGGRFSFLTFLYIGFVAAFTLPVFYERYNDEIDQFIHIVIKEANKYFRMFEERILSKIPRAAQKKSQ